MGSQEINTLKAQISDFFRKMFDMFGHEKVKRDIEIILIHSQKLYDIFHEWFYSEGHDSTEGKPKNTREGLLPEININRAQNQKVEEEKHVRLSNQDHLLNHIRASADEKYDDNFPLSNNYKASAQSRPKTTLDHLSSTEDRKDVDFNLSPSQTNSNSKHGKYIYLNAYIHHHRFAQK